MLHIAQPTLIARPFHREGWVYEEKVGGYRMVAYKSAGKVTLISRNGRDHTQRFAGIAEAIRLIPEATLVLGRRGSHLRPAVRVAVRVYAPPRSARVGDTAAVYGDRLPAYREEGPAPEPPLRSAELLYKQDQVLPVRRLADDGFKAWQQVLEGGWEAYVAKGPQSSYVGGRTLKWPKVKQRDYRTRLAAGC